MELLAERRISSGCAPADVPWQEASPIDRLEGRWWLVHTKSRQEKALADDLEAVGVGVYLPLARVQRRYGTRSVEIEMPLFPTYLFICGNEDARYRTLTTHRAAQVIPVADQHRLRTELRHVYQVTTSEHAVDLYPGLRKGRRCRIISGGLQGVEGVVVRRNGLCRVYLGVEILGQSAELEIDAALLELLD